MRIATVSEGVSDGEVEGYVALPAGVEQRPSALPVCGIMGFNPHVEAQQEIVEVHAQPQAVGECIS